MSSAFRTIICCVTLFRSASQISRSDQVPKKRGGQHVQQTQQQQLLRQMKQPPQPGPPELFWKNLPSIITALMALIVGLFALNFKSWSTRRIARQDHIRKMFALTLTASFLSACGGAPPLPLPLDVVVPTQNSGGQTPGIVPGSFSVTGDGAATYTVPLWVPPGRAGMQPELSIDYDSRNGEGLLGQGWSLRGLSRIARCRKTKADEKHVEAVAFRSDDPLCLDGQRLALVQGDPQANGAEYRTVPDRFIRIVISAHDALGPREFTAYLKDGRVLTFGAVQDSARVQVLPPVPSNTIPATNFWNAPAIVGPVRVSWSVSRIEDPVGNTIDVEYLALPAANASGLKTPQPVDLLPKTISYTGSIWRGEAAPTRFVKFFYKSAREFGGTFDSFKYMSGIPWWTGARLDRVEMWGPNPVSPAMLRTYAFAYELPSVTGRLLLAGISAKDQFGVQVGTTTFEWETGSVRYDVTDLHINDFSHDPRYRWLLPMDVDGDGKTDLLYIPQRDNSGSFDTYFVRFSNGTGFGDKIDTHWKYDGAGRAPVVVNANTDGRDDMLVYVDSADPDADPTPCMIVSNSADHSAPGFAIKTYGSKIGLVGDLNGDGITDLISYAPGDQDSWSDVMSASGSDFVPGMPGLKGPVDTAPNLSIPNLTQLDVVDVDGAGQASILGWDGNDASTRRSVYKRSEPNIGVAPGTLPIGPYTTLWGDVNGDGLSDAVYWGGYQTTLWTFLNTGNGFVEHDGTFDATGSPNYFSSVASEPTIGPNTFIDAGTRVFDYDGDGRSDILIRAGSFIADDSGSGILFGDHFLVLRSTGTTFSQAKVTWPSHIPTPIRIDDAFSLRDGGLVQVLDINGDGLDDLVIYDSGSLFLYKHAGKKPDQLVGVTDGFGAVTSIVWEPISNPTVYKPGTNCAYPVVCLDSKLWVVSEHAVSNGSGGMNRYHYTYEDGRRNLRGRDFLGMRTRTRTFVQTGETQIVTFDLENYGVGGYDGDSFYPYLGLPVSVRTTAPLENGVSLVHQVETSYWPSVDPSGKTWFPFANAYSETESEIGPAGTTVFRTKHTTQDVDGFGNIVSQTRKTGDGLLYKYHAQYENDVSKWQIRRLSLETETSVTADHQAQTRRRAYRWDSNGLLLQEIIEPGARLGSEWLPRVPAGPGDDGVKTLYRTYERQSTGLIRRVTLDAVPQTSIPTAERRITTFTYADPDEVFPASVTNPMNQRIRSTFHPGLGTLAASDDFNGVLSSWKVDGFGRTVHDETAGGSARSIAYDARAGSPPGRPLLQRTEAIASGATRIVEFDLLGRPIVDRITTRNDGQPAVIDLEYDPLGRGVRSVSLPHFAAAPLQRTRYDYDNAGRVRNEHRADGARIDYQYAGLTTSRFDAKGLNTEKSQMSWDVS
jgi:YD repeat-containing protein